MVADKESYTVNGTQVRHQEDDGYLLNEVDL